MHPWITNAISDSTASACFYCGRLGVRCTGKMALLVCADRRWVLSRPSNYCIARSYDRKIAPQAVLEANVTFRQWIVYIGPYAVDWWERKGHRRWQRNTCKVPISVKYKIGKNCRIILMPVIYDDVEIGIMSLFIPGAIIGADVLAISSGIISMSKSLKSANVGIEDKSRLALIPA